MRIVADLHIHSRYSRACSREMNALSLARWAEIKGVQLLGTGDFTHPCYLAELKAELEPTGGGLLRPKKRKNPPYFMLTVEVSNIYRQGGRLRKIHSLLFAPDFTAVDKINHQLAKSADLAVDGRPTLTFPAKDLVKIALDASPDCLVVPAHAWTPWFSVFGSHSGFDSLEECFAEEIGHIRAIETGLSSDPAMNWRWPALDRLALISNSDAHSPRKLAREANVLDCEPTYRAVTEAFLSRDPDKFLFTIEFFPEEGKYHLDGHRNCRVRWRPAETKGRGGLCPVCGGKVTVGVLHRVEELATEPPGRVPARAVPSRHLVPLEEILAQALGVGPAAKAVSEEYDRLTGLLRSELYILLDASAEELKRAATDAVADSVLNIRRENVRVEAGYDGVYGKITALSSPVRPSSSSRSEGDIGQLDLL
jgi:uncharacterized protein (TIGR00375 family)